MYIILYIIIDDVEVNDKTYSNYATGSDVSKSLIMSGLMNNEIMNIDDSNEISGL